MKTINEAITEGVLDMDDDFLDKVSSSKTVKNAAEYGEMFDAWEKLSATREVTKDALHNPIEPGDWVLYCQYKNIKGHRPLELGKVLNVTRVVSIQTKKGRVNAPSDYCIKINREDIIK